MREITLVLAFLLVIWGVAHTVRDINPVKPSPERVVEKIIERPVIHEVAKKAPVKIVVVREVSVNPAAEDAPTEGPDEAADQSQELTPEHVCGEEAYEVQQETPADARQAYWFRDSAGD